jgi:hypothetical protein
MRDLFGHATVSSTVDLPSHLQALSDRVGEARGFAPDRIIQLMTLFPYYTAFEPESVRNWVRRSMLGAGERLHVRTGLAAFRISRPRAMLFCPECLLDMKGLYGEPYWRRDHQLPSVLLCPEHGVPLRQSDLAFHSTGRHAFVPASDYVCRNDSEPVMNVDSDAALVHLQRLAISSADLMEAPPDTRDFPELTEVYRSRMARVGLMRSPEKVDQQRFAAEFRSYFGSALDHLPHVLNDQGFAGGWLAAIVRNHRKATHPLYHLLLRIFLDDRAEVPSPFGTGPWPCRNPLADHCGFAVIERLKQHRNRGRVVGVYSCTCGYTYIRAVGPDGVLGPPRYQKFGPLLAPELRRVVGAGCSLRQASRDLGLDPKTLMREAASLRLPVPWTLRPSGQPRCPDPPERPNGSSAPRRETKHLPRTDWPALDKDLSQRINAQAEVIRAETPPLRVSVAELERRLGLRNWIVKRGRLLPLTMHQLEQTLEDRSSYRERRTRWIIRSLAESGTMPARWQVMRQAGLTSAEFVLIDRLLSEALTETA